MSAFKTSKVLLLGPLSDVLRPLISSSNVYVARYDGPPTGNPQDWEDWDLVVSYGYRYVIGGEVLTACKRPPVNLHISLLPWNRGADPNFWSWMDDTPKGVSIHEMVPGLDKGPIITQKEVDLSEARSFSDSYSILTSSIVVLFEQSWQNILEFDYSVDQQLGVGSYHRTADKEPYLPGLSKGWETSFSDFFRWLKNEYQ